MPWFKVDDTLNAHPKARKAGLPAMGLWAVSGAYAMQYLTEGFVPEWYVVSWPNGKKLAIQLVAARLWFEDECDGETGWRFHQWGERQPTKAQVEEDREATRLRVVAWRDKQRTERVSNGVTGDVTNSVTNGVSTPAPTQPDPALVVKDSPNADALTLIPTETPTPVDDRFDEFWDVYPRKVGKLAARKKYATVLKTGVTPDRLITAAASYARSVKDPKYTKHPDAWLNTGRWDDEPDQPRSNSHDRSEAMIGLKGEARAAAIRTAWM